MLGTEKIPQANNLDTVVEVVRDLHRHGEVSAARIELVDRQVAYYKHAARVLGLISASDMISLTGRRLLGADGIEVDTLLRSQFESSECGWAWASWAKKRLLRQVDPDTSEDFLRATVPTLSANTAGRRAQTLTKWHQRLFGPR